MNSSTAFIAASPLAVAPASKVVSICSSTCHVVFASNKRASNIVMAAEKKGNAKAKNSKNDAAKAEPPNPASCTGIPASFEDSIVQMKVALQKALDQGYSRILIEVDTTVGDATYTALKNSIPLAKEIAMLLSDGSVNYPTFNEAEKKDGAQYNVKIVMPDAGAAALLKRDWAEIGARFSIVGFENESPRVEDDAFVVVAPRASEVEKLEKLTEMASPFLSSKARPVIMINPDLVDMGVTGLGLAARELRQRLLSTFETVYYLKSLPWGVILHSYPEDWSVWQDDVNAEEGFRLIKLTPKRPSADQLEQFLDEANPDEKSSSGGMFAKLGRFISMYMKG